MARDLYATRVVISGGRDGTARSGDGRLDLSLALPQDIGGTGRGTNPEQLFAAGFGACFASSLAFAAKGTTLAPADIAVAADVTLVLGEDGAYGIRAVLSATLPGLDDAEADRLIAEARRICAYSNALKGRAEVQVTRA